MTRKRATFTESPSSSYRNALLRCSALREDGRRSLTRVIAARGRLKKHESGARPAEASLIDGECRVIARSALFSRDIVIVRASFAVVVLVVVHSAPCF